jgi:hypothetical protein
MEEKRLTGVKLEIIAIWWSYNHLNMSNFWSPDVQCLPQNVLIPWVVAIATDRVTSHDPNTGVDRLSTNASITGYFAAH